MLYSFKQIGPLITMNLKTLPQRIGTASVIIIGIAAVVAVLVSVFSIAVGFQHTLADNGRADRVIILRSGSETEINSRISSADFATIASDNRIRRSGDGQAAASMEIVNVINLPKINTNVDANVTLRGVGPELNIVRPEIKIVEGRMFRPAVRELIVGVGAANQFKGLLVGSTLQVRNVDWKVVGLFTSDGDVHESELLGNVDAVGASLNQSGSYNSATLLLNSAGDFKMFKSSLASDPRFSIDLQRETDYYRNQSQQTTKFIRIFGGVVAFIMAFGAVFGALNSMYSAVRTRVTEIATLRAIGFDTGPILFSVIVEALLLSLVGGLIGAAVAWGFFNGYSVSTSGGSLSQVVFKLRIDGTLVLIGIATALIIGLVGGFFPALHATKAPVVEGLRGN